MAYATSRKYLNFGNGNAPTVRVRRGYVHPQYRLNTNRNDIAILELEKPITDHYDTEVIDLEAFDGGCGTWTVAYGFGETRNSYGEDGSLYKLRTQIQNGCPGNLLNWVYGSQFIMTQVEGKTACHVSILSNY